MASIFLIIAGVVCGYIMKNIQPEWFRPYVVYLVFVESIINGFLIYVYFFLK